MGHAGAHGERWWKRISARRFRTACVLLAIASVVISASSAAYRLAVGVAISPAMRAAVALEQGEVQFWWFGKDAVVHWRDPTNNGATRVGTSVERQWSSTLNLSWRPYHIAHQRFPKYSSSHALAVPLWPLVVGAILLAGYSHGLVVGGRRSTIGRCRACGYDLRSLPKGASCPECGPAAQADVVTAVRSAEKSFTKSGS